MLVNNLRDGTNHNGLANQGGSSYGRLVDGPTSRSVALDGVICKRCCRDIVLDALILDYLRVLISQRRKDRAESAACRALDHVIGSSLSDSAHEKGQSPNSQQTINVQQLLSGGESLAEFPGSDEK